MAQMKGNMVERVQDIQRRWYEHVERMCDERLPRQMLYGRVHGKKPRGRPRIGWWKQLRTANPTISAAEMTRLARERQAWRDYRHALWDPT